MLFILFMGKLNDWHACFSFFFFFFFLFSVCTHSLCVCRGQSTTLFFTRVKQTEKFFEMPEQMYVAVFLSFSTYIYISSLNTVNNSDICSPFYSPTTIHPLKYLFGVCIFLLVVFFFTFIIYSHPKFTVRKYWIDAGAVEMWCCRTWHHTLRPQIFRTEIFFTVNGSVCITRMAKRSQQISLICLDNVEDRSENDFVYGIFLN